MKPAAFLLLSLLPVAASAGNFATCVLDLVPGTVNQQAFHVAIRVCDDRYPDGLDGVEWGAGKGWFSKYKSPDECFADKAKATLLPAAVGQIRNACEVLYGEEPKPVTAPDMFRDLMPRK